MQEPRIGSLGQEDSLEKEWQPTPVFLPGKSHGNRRLVGYSPWGCKELDTTCDKTTTAATLSHSSLHTHTHTHTLMLTFFLIPSPHIITHSCLLSLFPSCYFFSFYISDVQNLHLTGTWGNDYVLGNTPTKEIKVIIST